VGDDRRTATFLYMMGVVGFACVRRRDGAIVFLFGMGMFVTSLIYTDLVTNTVIPRMIGIDVLPIGTLVLLFSHIVIWRSAGAWRSTTPSRPTPTSAGCWT
jgi:hypothetical protein